MKTTKAFTLLEILVVVGIMSILIGLGTLSFTTSQKKARDAKRKGDLKSIQGAMEQYYSVCGFQYPGSLGSSIVCTSPTTAIMPTVPTDPKTTTPYPCSPCSTSSYTLCTTLESETITSYCVSNQQ